MGLRKKFKERAAQRQHKREEKHRARVNQQLENIAVNLPTYAAEIRPKIEAWEKNWEQESAERKELPEGATVLKICRDALKMIIIDDLEFYDEKTLPGYKKLHEACIKENVCVSILRTYGSPYLNLSFDGPYNDSPDADFFKLKRPEAGQLKLPGF